MSVLASLLLLVSAQQPEAQPLPGEIHNFKDWVVACDNGLRCEAASLVPEPKAAELEAPAGQEPQDPWERFGVMMFERGPEADAPLVVTISDFEGVPAQLLQYEAPVEGVRIVRAEEGLWRLELTEPQKFVDVLYTGTIVVKDGAGKTLSELALDGAYGVLLYMDERQGRLRTPTAVIRRGRRPVSLIPAPPPLPVVRVAPRTQEPPLTIPPRRLAEIRRQVECAEEQPAREETHELAALGNGKTLIMMSCGAGAYNLNSLPLVAWREGGAIRAEPARFDIHRDEIEEQANGPYHLTNAEFDPETMSISEFAKGRGLGDCGLAATYAWDGTMFRMTERHEMSECRGAMAHLTTWRTERR